MSYFWAAMRHYVTFNGRTSLKSFWIFQLIITIVTTFFWVIPFIYTIQHLPQLIEHISLNTNNSEQWLQQMLTSSHQPSFRMPLILEILNNLGTLFFVITFVPTLSISARRLHDSNHSAALLWLLLAPFVGFIILAIYLALKGTPGDNRFGPNPQNATGGTIIPSITGEKQD